MNSRQGFDIPSFFPETLGYLVGLEGKMAKGILAFPKNTLEHARVVRKGWEELSGRFSPPNLTIEEFARRLEHAEELVSKAEQLRRLRAEAVRKRDEALSEMWVITKKVRNAAKAIFGDDSPEVQKLMLEPTRQWKRLTQKQEEDE